MTRGRRLLIALLQSTRARFVAGRCQVHQSQVSRWVAGEQKPSIEARRWLDVNYGIPVESWAVRSGDPSVNGRTRSR